MATEQSSASTDQCPLLPNSDQQCCSAANDAKCQKQICRRRLVSEAVAGAKNITCIDAPPGNNELELVDLKTAASVKVKPPRITASPVAFECRFLNSISLVQTKQ